LNFDNYRYFAAAAEELNFTKAARKLFMTQQALSKQIDKMEKEYNTRLFNRETPMSLTPAGECMYRHVCRILDNETESIRFSTIARICSALDCTPGDLFEVHEEEDPYDGMY